MSMQNPIADMYTRIRNAQMVGHAVVRMPSSKLKLAVLAVLKEQGFVAGYIVEGTEAKPSVLVTLKYYQNAPVIKMLKQVSRPALRVYKAAGDFPEVMGGLGVVIVSTSKGVMVAQDARAQKLGGEILCYVF